MAPAAPSTTMLMPLRTLARRRRQKYSAARSFFLVVALVAAFAIWSSYTGGTQRSGLGGNRALWKRSGLDAAYSATGGLVRRDEEVDKRGLYPCSRLSELKTTDSNSNSAASSTTRRINAHSFVAIAQTKKPAYYPTSNSTTADYMAQSQLHS